MHKILLNRLSVVLFLLLLQVAIIVWFIKEAAEYYVIFNVVIMLISIVFAVKAFRNKLPANTKIPIIMLLIVFPISGIFLYYFSLENRMRKKLVKNYKNQTFTLESLYIENKAIRKQLLQENKEIYHQSQYIANTTYLPAYADNYTEFFDDGKPFFDSLLQDLKQAKHFIFLEFFIIGKGALWASVLDILKQKVKEGVEVRVIYDDIGSFKTLPDKYDKKLEKMGIHCVVFNPISPTISLIHNNRDHKKIVVIDGKVSYTGGLNIADEYINLKKRFGHWKDAGIKIVGDATKSFTLMFLETWHYFKNSSEDCSIYLNIPQHFSEPSSGYVQPYCGDPMNETPVTRNVYLNMIQSAQNYIYITTPYLALDQEFLEALFAASNRGVDVRIVVPHICDKKYIFYVTESYAKELIPHRIKLYEYMPGFVHSKTLLVDDKIGTVGTVNFDYRSFYHNYECGVLLYKTTSIDAIKKDFQTLFPKCVEVNEKYMQKHFTPWRRFLGEVYKIFSPLF